MTVTRAAIGNAAQVLRIAADVMAELALEDEGGTTTHGVLVAARDQMWERIRSDGQLGPALKEWTTAQRGAFALVAVTMTELAECFAAE